MVVMVVICIVVSSTIKTIFFLYKGFCLFLNIPHFKNHITQEFIEINQHCWTISSYYQLYISRLLKYLRLYNGFSFRGLFTLCDKIKSVQMDLFTINRDRILQELDIEFLLVWNRIQGKYL